MSKKFTIIKIGSNVLVDEKNNIRKKIIFDLLQNVGQELQKGNKIMLVTSGAVALGRSFFSDQKVDKKLAAGIGQMKLMSVYSEMAEELHLSVSELLLSRPHLVERQHFLELQKSMESAFDNGIIPVVNENDALVYGTDWSFGDNDSLASSLAIAFSADKLLILSNVAGLYSADPGKTKGAELISEVKNVNHELMKLCSTDTSDKGRGGMISKLKAARLCTAVGIETQIISGIEIGTLKKALDNEKVGTTFFAKQNAEIKNRERWILAARTSAASIEIDSGAEGALVQGRSLLAVGIRRIIGSFRAKELVQVINKNSEDVAIGLVDLGSEELQNIDFKKQKGVQVMHADNIMVL